MSKECSGGVSKAWRAIANREPPFEYCCDEHDTTYTKGGTERDRIDADLNLRKCIASNGYPKTATFFYYSVRIFGWLFWNYR